MAKKKQSVILKSKMSELRGELSVDEEFDAILGNIIDEALLDDPSEGDSSAVRSPTNSNRQVLATLAVAEGSYGEIADRVGLVPEANSRIITKSGQRLF